MIKVKCEMNEKCQLQHLIYSYIRFFFKCGFEHYNQSHISVEFMNDMSNQSRFDLSPRRTPHTAVQCACSLTEF